MRKLMAVLVLFLLFVGGIGARADTRESRQGYWGSIGDFGVYCPYNLGGACFSLFGDEFHADITIQDAQGWIVGGSWHFIGPGSQVIASGNFCKDVSVPVPSGAVALHIHVKEVFSRTYCGTISAGTWGEIRATFQYTPPPGGGGCGFSMGYMRLLRETDNLRSRV